MSSYFRSPYMVDGNDPHQSLVRGMDLLRRAIKSGEARLVSVTTRAGEVMDRHLALVEVASFHGSTTSYASLGEWWADCITGTLYHPRTGVCRSSDQMFIALETLAGMAVVA